MADLDLLAKAELAKQGVPPTAANLNMIKQHLLLNPQAEGDERTAGRTTSGIDLSRVSGSPVDDAIMRGEGETVQWNAPRPNTGLDDAEMPPQPKSIKNKGDDESVELSPDNEGAEGELDLTDHSLHMPEDTSAFSNLLKTLGVGAAVGGGAALMGARANNAKGTGALEGDIMPMDESSIEATLMKMHPELASQAAPAGLIGPPPKQLPAPNARLPAPAAAPTPEAARVADDSTIELPDQRTNQRMNLNQTQKAIEQQLDDADGFELKGAKSTVAKNRVTPHDFSDQPKIIVKDAKGVPKYHILPDGSMVTTKGKALTPAMRKSVLKLLRMHL